jgi:hypothetical protein
MMKMNNNRIFRIPFATIYDLLVQKALRKNRTQEEVNQIITWLTGYSEAEIQEQHAQQVDYRTFWENAPIINPNAAKIMGVICGYRVEEITDPLMQKVRWLDKLVDELAKGRPLEKILRK